MNNIFASKEQYLRFRARWKQLHTEGFHKRVKVQQVRELAAPTVVGYHNVSPMHIGYHFLFNVAMGRDVRKTMKGYKDNYPACVHLNDTLDKPYGAALTLFGGILTGDQRSELLELAKKQYSLLVESETT